MVDFGIPQGILMKMMPYFHIETIDFQEVKLEERLTMEHFILLFATLFIGLIASTFCFLREK